MSVLGVLRRTLVKTIYLRRFGAKWAGALADHAAWPMPPASVRDGALVVDGMDPLADPGGATPVLLKWLREVRQLCRRGAKVSVHGDEIHVRIDGIEAKALNEADLGIFFEIFSERVYDFESPGPFLILDIGANIGIASLFFARYFDAEVRAYELVPSTAAIAQANILLNPDLAPRIILESFGLAEADGEFEIPVAAALRSSNSIHGLIQGDGSTERVTVRDAVSVFEEALQAAGERKLVVKLDAEGAEYEIVARLASASLLSKIDLLFLEWHEREGKSPEELRVALREAGFQWFERRHGEAPVGYITAFRA